MDDYNLVGFVMRYSMIKKRIAAKYLKEEDLNTFESILLGIVYKKQECSQDKIGEITLFDGASIARALKNLEIADLYPGKLILIIVVRSWLPLLTQDRSFTMKSVKLFIRVMMPSLKA